MTKGEIIRYLILRTIGNFLLLFAIFGVFATFGPSIYYEAKFRIDQVRGVEYKVIEESNTSPLGEVLRRAKEQQFKESGGLAALLTGQKEQILIPKDPLFSLLIPKIGASAKVFANIDSTNEKQYLSVLRNGVAHAKGTSFPGMKSNIYLFAHSTDNFWDVGRYNAVFYLLKDLKMGDEIVIFFQNFRYNYLVSEVKVVESSEISYLTHQKKEEEILILQTCWPPGTTWKRLIVIARPR